ncbi:MAG: OmpA family protein [Limnochordaceae bacterium]|nr:OmpA family protein [Limnochordaceae bacterium]
MSRESAPPRRARIPIPRRPVEGSDASDADVWLTTYADLISLMLTLFVALFAFANIDQQRFMNVISSVQGALGVPPGQRLGSGGIAMSPWLMKAQQERQQLQQVMAQLQAVLPPPGQSGISVVQEERGIVVRFSDQALFDVGQADLRPEAQEVLKQVVPILRRIDNPIRAEGHTDNLPIRTSRFPTNWELSTARASMVVRFLAEQGIDEHRLSAAGYGELRPIASNATPEGRARNRRVDLVILSQSESHNEPNPSTPRGSAGT